MSHKIIDRRNEALGGQNHTRNISSIQYIAWHYTAALSFITNHERYWRRTLGWWRGGYHFYIDRNGNIYWNYDFETVSNGVGGHNSKLVNICVEARNKNDYTTKQVEAREWITRYVMGKVNVAGGRVLGHKEFRGATTACPGYSKSEMNAFRQKLSNAGGVSGGNAKTIQSANSGESIVDFMTNQGMDSSFSNRKHLAENVYKTTNNFRGTAAQNTALLERLEVELAKKEEEEVEIESIVDWMNANGMDSSYSNRSKLAEKHGISGYKGTADQNIELLEKLKKEAKNKDKSYATNPNKEGRSTAFDRGQLVQLRDEATHWESIKDGDGTFHSNPQIDSFFKDKAFRVEWLNVNGSVSVAHVDEEGVIGDTRYQVFDWDLEEFEEPDKYFRVQLGAYAERGNAEAKAEEAERAGFETYIKED